MQIKDEIEKLRMKLNKMCLVPDIKLYEGEILKLSEKLDTLITEHYNKKN